MAGWGWRGHSRQRNAKCIGPGVGRAEDSLGAEGRPVCMGKEERVQDESSGQAEARANSKPSSGLWAEGNGKPLKGFNQGVA